jgi:hypothetical protein
MKLSDLRVFSVQAATLLHLPFLDHSHSLALIGLIAHFLACPHQKKSTFLIPSYYILLHLIALILRVRKE